MAARGGGPARRRAGDGPIEAAPVRRARRGWWPALLGGCRDERRGRRLAIEALEPLGHVREARAPFAHAEAREEGQGEDEQELELGPRVRHDTA